MLKTPFSQLYSPSFPALWAKVSQNVALAAWGLSRKITNLSQLHRNELHYSELRQIIEKQKTRLHLTNERLNRWGKVEKQFIFATLSVGTKDWRVLRSGFIPKMSHTSFFVSQLVAPILPFCRFITPYVSALYYYFVGNRPCKSLIFKAEASPN